MKTATRALNRPRRSLANRTGSLITKIVFTPQGEASFVKATKATMGRSKAVSSATAVMSYGVVTAVVSVWSEPAGGLPPRLHFWQ